MPCLVGCIALMVPRLALVGIFVFSNYLERAFHDHHKVWPLLGFVFMPTTTLAYAFVKNTSPGGVIDGWYLALIVLAALIDLGLLGRGGKGIRRRGVRWYRRDEASEA